MAEEREPSRSLRSHAGALRAPRARPSPPGGQGRLSAAASLPYEIVGDPRAGGPFLFTCEHAGRLLPEWEPEPTDRPLLEEHWGWDIGAADLTRALTELTRSCAVLSRFSRLVCDPNRAPTQPSFVVGEVDGVALSFNRRADEAERRRRRQRYFEIGRAHV